MVDWGEIVSSLHTIKAAVKVVEKYKDQPELSWMGDKVEIILSASTAADGILNVLPESVAGKEVYLKPYKNSWAAGALKCIREKFSDLDLPSRLKAIVDSGECENLYILIMYLIEYVTKGKLDQKRKKMLQVQIVALLAELWYKTGSYKTDYICAKSAATADPYIYNEMCDCFKENKDPELTYERIREHCESF